MALYGIADLHLSFTADKPMDIYGPAWENHTKRLEENWRGTISQEDTVIIAGDISWGLKLEEAMADLEWIHALPGFKVLFKGNHDPWWASISRLNSLFDDMYFVQNSFYPYGDTAICGTRGWLCPGSSEFTEGLGCWRRRRARSRFRGWRRRRRRARCGRCRCCYCSPLCIERDVCSYRCVEAVCFRASGICIPSAECVSGCRRISRLCYLAAACDCLCSRSSAVTICIECYLILFCLNCDSVV